MQPSPSCLKRLFVSLYAVYQNTRSLSIAIVNICSALIPKEITLLNGLSGKEGAYRIFIEPFASYLFYWIGLTLFYIDDSFFNSVNYKISFFFINYK